MEILRLWIHQADCPFITTSDNFDVKYHHNLIEVNVNTTVKRGYITAKDPEELQNCLDELFGSNKLLNYLIYEKCPTCISMRMDLNHTHAMDVLIKNGGYVVGPFVAEKGKELWQVGFDDRESMENFLDDLFPTDDYTILSHSSLPMMNEMNEIIDNLEEVAFFVKTLEELTPIEKDTLIKAIKGGYYEQPRKMDLTELSEVFGISKVAIHKNLKRAEHKVMMALLKLLINFEAKEQEKKLAKKHRNLIKNLK